MSEEIKTITISKWARMSPDGKMLRMVIQKWPTGEKNKKGKATFYSRTRHIPV